MSTASIRARSRTGPEDGEKISVGLILTPLLLGALAYGVLGTVIVPALPLFQRELHTSENGATWLLTAYFLSAAASTAVLGRLGDMFGKRRMLLVTLGILICGTLVSAMSDSLTGQITGRTLQGVAGGLFPLAFGIIRDEFPPERVASGIAAVSATLGLGSVGVILPGLIVPHLDWHWLYWIPMILTVIAFVGTWVLVRESPVRPGGRVNWLNTALMIVGITAVVLGVSEGGTWGFSSVRTLALLVGGLVVCGIWVAAEVSSENPLIDMRLMRQRAVWATSLVSFALGAGMYAAFAVYPVLAQLPKGTGYGASMLRCGLYLLPMSVGSAISTPFAERLANRIGAARTLITGALIEGAGFGYMAVWSSHPYDMIISLGVMGFGLGFAFPTLMTLTVQSVPAEQVGETAGMSTVVRMIGGAIATQIVATLISRNQDNGLPNQTGFDASYITLAAFMVVAALAALAVRVRRPDSHGAGRVTSEPVPVPERSA
ncbi:MFS transporter [Frankia sp. AgPm24]|uniref:MFS transporter n=1 Tax=Frankia sp. AgPm24 TaxID=631128 RepID=UPI0020105DBB|nr:MFS transporter [Frankia sp. AgPm24]MCK9924170.1 MFS transporter [Frankia sp. AgPm24]